MGKKLLVEVCNAADLMPKDGQGSASSYCTLEFDGQRRKTETKQKDLNPAWNTLVEFPIPEGKSIDDEVLEVCVICEKRGAQRKPGFLGRVRIPGRSIPKKGEESLVYYPLERRSIFSHVKGELGLKVWWDSEQVPAAAPAQPPPAEPPVQASPPPETVEASSSKDAEAPSSSSGAPAPPPAAPVAAAPVEDEEEDEHDHDEPEPVLPEIVTEFIAAAAEAAKAPEPVPAPVPEPPPRVEERAVPVVVLQIPPLQEYRSVEKKKKGEAAEEKPEKREEKPEKKKEEKEEREEKHEKKEEKKEEKKKEHHKEEVKKEHKFEREFEEVEPPREPEKKEKKAEKKEEKKEEPKKEEPKKKEKKNDSHAPSIVIQPRGEEHPKKMTSTVPSAEFVLKETKPVLSRGVGEKVVTYDMVEKMNYLFVKVVKARGLKHAPGPGAYSRIVFGSLTAKTKETSMKSLEWHEVFSFSKDNSGGPVVEVSVRDSETDQLLGAVMFDLSEIPFRVPPDSPLAPQWYKLESLQRNGEHNGKDRGDIMLAIWWGTQADEAFTESWQSDSGGYAHTRGKVYLSPKLWYLRVTVIEAQELQPSDKTRYPEVSVRAHLGRFQNYKTKVCTNRNTSPFWNEDLMFVAAEPFEDELVLVVHNTTSRPGEEEALGVVKIPLGGIPRRIDMKLDVKTQWFTLSGSGSDDKRFHGRLHLKLCFEGGYHVMDEPTHYRSCVRPTAKQLWRPVVGFLELGIIRGSNIHPMKTVNGRGATDAYCVAKYGQKWVRTRTVVDNLNPRWNEQYSWEVYDPCTVLTVGMFDNCHVHPHSDHDAALRDLEIGKVRIRLSTLESERIYTNCHPLLMLQRSGVRKLGEIELAVRYSSISIVNVIGLYFRPLLPKMHYSHPLGVTQSEVLRIVAMRLVAERLNRSEPPLRQEVVQYMLDADFHIWSLRRSKVNYFRIMNLLAGPMAVAAWFHNICHWKNPVTTLLVHVLFLILVMYPELVLPTLFLYLALIGAWHYRYRPRSPPSMDGKLSQAERVEPDELDEEFDPIPTHKDPNVVKARYDRLRIVSSRIQNVLGDLATQGERVTALLSWRDPRASGIMVAVCMSIAVILYVVPLRLVLVMFGLYVLRHPRFRNTAPGWPSNFFKRLPSLADRIL